MRSLKTPSSSCSSFLFRLTCTLHCHTERALCMHSDFKLYSVETSWSRLRTCMHRLGRTFMEKGVASFFPACLDFCIFSLSSGWYNSHFGERQFDDSHLSPSWPTSGLCLLYVAFIVYLNTRWSRIDIIYHRSPGFRGDTELMGVDWLFMNLVFYSTYWLFEVIQVNSSLRHFALLWGDSAKILVQVWTRSTTTSSVIVCPPLILQ